MAAVLSSADIERRLLAALAEPTEGAEDRKRALLDCLRVLAWADVRHAIAGDLGLWLRAMRPGSMRLELAVASLETLPWGVLKAEGFKTGRTTCSRQGTSIRFRAVRPAALARAETFGKLAGASDLLSGKLADANARWMPPHARGRAIDEAVRLLEQNPEAADEVANAKKTLREAREKLMKWKGIPMEKKTTKLQSLIGVAKELFALFGVFVLLIGCGGATGSEGSDGGLGGAGGSTASASGPNTGITCTGGTLCPVGNCVSYGSPATITGVCCDGCVDTSACLGTSDYRACIKCIPFGTLNAGHSSLCTISYGGVGGYMSAGQMPCNGCYEATSCKDPQQTLPVVLDYGTCGVCHPSGGKLTYTLPSGGSQTITCDGTTWR